MNIGMGKWTSRPRAVRISVKRNQAGPGSGPAGVYPSVAAAGRAVGMSPHSVQAYLSGRAGKRSAYVFEYADGRPSRARQGDRERVKEGMGL